MADEPVELTSVTYADIANIESELQDVDAAVTAFQYLLSQRAYKKRKTVVSQIPRFWGAVLEAAPPELDQHILPSDSDVLNKLTDLSVDRFDQQTPAEIFTDLVKTGDALLDITPLGEPRNFSLRFEFAENEWFEDKVLEKKFWFRHARDGWAGLVSEPVKIHWKAGRDLTEGLLDSAIALWEAQKKAGFLKGDGSKEAKEHEEKAKELPEYKTIADKVENSMEGSQSFFTFFGFRGRWVSEEENKIAAKEQREKREKESTDADEEDEDEDDEEELTLSESAAEIFFDGEDVATTLADDVYPHATQYFMEANDPDVDLSEGSFDEDELDAMDDDDEDEDMDGDEAPQLTKRKGRKSGDDMPTKKPKA